MSKVTICRWMANVVWALELIFATIVAIQMADYIILSLWNFTMPYLLHLPEMQKLQGISLFLMLDILFDRTKPKEWKKFKKFVKKRRKEMQGEFERIFLYENEIPGSIKDPIPPKT